MCKVGGRIEEDVGRNGSKKKKQKLRKNAPNQF